MELPIILALTVLIVGLLGLPNRRDTETNIILMTIARMISTKSECQI